MVHVPGQVYQHIVLALPTKITMSHHCELGVLD